MKSEVRVLIVDDEVAVRNILRMGLQKNGYKVHETVDAQSGLKAVAEFHPHLVLLDLGLPDMAGLQVLKDLRAWSRVPVIVLTVNDSDQSKVDLLDAGADDYLTKPFSMQELTARVRVALRNVGLIEATPVFRSEELEVDLTQRKVLVSGQEVRLTNTEFEVLSRLIRDHGKVVSQMQLLKQVWGACRLVAGNILQSML